MIDFTSFGRLFSKLPVSKQIQHMKFVHNLQPIGEQKQRFNKHPATPNQDRCPCCHTEIETQLHLLQCRTNIGRKPALARFTKKGKIRGDNHFQQIMVDLMVQWLTDPNLIPTFEKSRDTFLQHDIIPVEYTSLVNRAIMEQTSIGWIHATRGFLTKTWSLVASSRYTTQCMQTDITPEGGHRIQKLLRSIHRVTTDIWCGRNDMLHDNQAVQAAEVLKHTVDAEISKFHREPDLMLTDDIHYSEQSLKRLLHSSASTKRRWLHRVKLSRKKKADMISRQPRILKFFQKVPSTQQNPCTSHAPAAITQKPPKPTTSRNHTTQQLLTQFFRERAPNPRQDCIPLSPSPSHDNHD